jgi:2-furoate---CoA ligase
VNLAEHLVGCAERHPDALALVDGERRVTYAELLEDARRVAGGLVALGVGRGDRVAVALRNREETVLLWWATVWLGGVFTPLNWRLRPAELRYCVENAESALLAVEPDSAGVAGLVQGVPVVDVAGAGVGTPFAELRAAEPAGGALDVDDREPALMLYTSGTTGNPKGVPRSHAAERAAAVAQVAQCGHRPAERTLGVMPLYHTMGQRAMLTMTLVGGSLHLMGDWDGAGALAITEADRLTCLYLAPTLFHDLALAHAAAPRDISSVRRIAYAGAPMTGVLVERLVELFDPEVFVNHYGSTEIYTFTIHGDQRAKPGCAGRPGMNARIRLVRPEPGAPPDDVVAPGEVGQIACALSSDEAFAGYWRRPDADEKQIRGGWYFPGDLAQEDVDGDLWIVGRIDDMVISGGENVHPLEIEEHLVRHPAVLEAAVIGHPDERLGQIVAAYVVTSAPVGEEELDAHCLASPDLARFKRPRRYIFVDELPKSASGKLLRRLLKEEDE